MCFFSKKHWWQVIKWLPDGRRVDFASSGTQSGRRGGRHHRQRWYSFTSFCRLFVDFLSTFRWLDFHSLSFRWLDFQSLSFCWLDFYSLALHSLVFYSPFLQFTMSWSSCHFDACLVINELCACFMTWAAGQMIVDENFMWWHVDWINDDWINDW